VSGIGQPGAGGRRIDLESTASADDAATAAAPAPAAEPVDLPDPELMARDAAGALEGVVGFEHLRLSALVVDGPSVDDPTQGWMGNCYLIAAMGAVAFAAPDAIRRMMRENEDGTVTVRFHDIGTDGAATPSEVTVDREIVTRRGPDGARTPYYASSPGRDAGGRQEIWPAILEKAYAQRAGGYEKIGMGGSSAAALEALTGKKAAYDKVGERVGPSDLVQAEIIAKFLGAKADIPLESLEKARRERGDAAWKWLREGVESGAAVVADTYAEPDVVLKGFLPIHAYAVIGAEERDGKRFVTLRNPAPYLAELESNPAIAEELRRDPTLGPLASVLTGKGLSLKDLKYGTFTVPFEDFRRCFDHAYRVPIEGGR